MLLTIIKKNRKYFKSERNGYACKVLIDDNSADLELGEQNLAVDDISVKSKYGTDVIYKLSASAEIQKDSGICTLKTAFYNKNLVESCHKLGGKWDGDEKVWVFPGFVEGEVEELDEKYNSKMVDIELSFSEDYDFYGYQAPFFVSGFKIATATGRDSDAKINDGIAIIKGGASGGGSRKNWCTQILDGSVIRMSMPELCIDDIEQNIDIKRL